MAVASAVAMSACAPAVEQAALRGPIREKTQLVVDNKNWLDVAVYLVRGSTRTRLGTVTSMSTGQFDVPDAYVLGVSDITVQADPIGASNAFTSDPIQVFPGARIKLQVANAIRLSTYGVYTGGTR